MKSTDLGTHKPVTKRPLWLNHILYLWHEINTFSLCTSGYYHQIHQRSFL